MIENWKLMKSTMEKIKKEEGPAALATSIEQSLSSPSDRADMKEAEDCFLNFQGIRENFLYVGGKIVPHLAQRFYQMRNLPKFMDYLLKAEPEDYSSLKGRLNPSMSDCLGDYWEFKILNSQNMSIWAPTLCQALQKDADHFEKDSAGM